MIRGLHRRTIITWLSIHSTLNPPPFSLKRDLGFYTSMHNDSTTDPALGFLRMHACDFS